MEYGVLWKAVPGDEGLAYDRAYLCRSTAAVEDAFRQAFDPAHPHVPDRAAARSRATRSAVMLPDLRVEDDGACNARRATRA